MSVSVHNLPPTRLSMVRSSERPSIRKIAFAHCDLRSSVFAFLSKIHFCQIPNKDTQDINVDFLFIISWTTSNIITGGKYILPDCIPQSEKCIEIDIWSNKNIFSHYNLQKNTVKLTSNIIMIFISAMPMSQNVSIPAP